MKRLLLLGLACGLAHAGSLPELTVPSTVGINIHFNRGHERDLDLMAEAGIRIVRMDFGWAGIERKRGEYHWSAYDELTAHLRERQMRPYYILDYSNPLYEETVVSKNPLNGEEQRDTASPQHPESIAAFARWAGAAAAHFAGQGIIWEIWNEPNISFWKPKPDVAQYIALAKAASRAVREADPQAILTGPATSEVPVKFLEAFFSSGILESLDAVSVHPYRNYRKSPETAAEDYKALRELITRYAPAGKKEMPILSGEWGYASHAKGVPPETQACFLVRQQLFNLAQKIPVSIWYDWKNDGSDPTEREQNFGIVTEDLKPKPAFEALRTLTRELSGCKLAVSIATGRDQDYALLFTGGLAGAKPIRKLALWTTEPAHDAVLEDARFGQGSAAAVNSFGRPASLTVETGRLKHTFHPLPDYVDLADVWQP